jgi:hypothetical protein
MNIKKPKINKNKGAKLLASLDKAIIKLEKLKKQI